MAVNGVTTSGSVAAYESYSFNAEVTKTETTKVSYGETQAAVFEMSEEAEKLGAAQQAENTEAAEGVEEAGKGAKAADPDMLAKLKQDAEQRTAAMKSLVEKLLLKQGGKLDPMADLFSDMNGKLADFFKNLEVDEETRAQAQKNISEEGEYGIEAVSDRILEFAKALAGNDPEKASQMLDAIKEGFKQAGEAWGEDLPDISQKTMDRTYEKVNAWLEELGGNSSSTDNGSGTTGAGASSSSYGATYEKQTTTTVKVSASYSKAAAASYAKQMEISDR